MQQKFKYWFLGMLGLLLVGMPGEAEAQLKDQAGSRAGLFFADCEVEEGPFDWMNKRKRKRRRKRNRTLALGAVVGGPVGFGGRAILRLGSLGVAGDLAYNRIRTDSGPLVDAFTSKLDLRLYSSSFFGKLLRFYVFGGASMHRGYWDGLNRQSVLFVDGGVGGGIKLWRLSFNAEAGLLLPARGVSNYQPRFGAFANVAVMLWLF